MSGVLVDRDLRRSAFVAGFATELVSVHFMIEGYGAFLAVVGYDVSGIGYGESKSDQHYGNNQFFHVFLSFGLVVWAVACIKNKWLLIYLP
jgi:hypothetical protein